MSIEAALFGTIGNDAQRKTSSKGKPYLRMNVRAGEGNAAAWVSVMVFDQDTIATADKFVKGARIYVEGKLSPTSWTSESGVERHGLSVMSWHCRLANIGRNRPERKSKPPRQDRVQTLQTAAAESISFNDEIGF